MKKNLFDSNKISLDQINICSNQINFYLKSNKLYLWPYINAIISLFWRKINLIQTNIYLVQRYFVWFKQILFHSNKSFLWIKKVVQTTFDSIQFDSIKSFFSVQRRASLFPPPTTLPFRVKSKIIYSLAKVSIRNSFRSNQNYSDSFRYLYPSQCESLRTNLKNVL